MVSTRKRSYNETPVEDEESLTTIRNRWSTFLRTQNYTPLILEVLAQELPKYTTSTAILPTSFAKILRECFLILASAPRIFTAAVDGTLTHQFPIDHELQEEYARISERAHIQPSIYIHLLADEAGTPPSAEQYMLIRTYILCYISTAPEDQDVAFEIDNVTHPYSSASAIRNGYRKYLQTTRRSARREETMLAFCAGIEARYLATPLAERNEALRYPPGECGYALNSHVRLQQHRKHVSSNYVMNLVADICLHLHDSGVVSQRFNMHQYIIYLIFRPTQVEIAEMFCSGLLQVYVKNGGGFNSYPAGLSTASSRRVGREEWREHEKWVRANSELEGMLKGMRERAEEWLGNGEEEVMAEVVRGALDSSSEGSEEDEEWMPKDEVDDVTRRLERL